MNKKLLAVAVAGALALPGVALAQSSVTISGFLKMSFGQLKINDAISGCTIALGCLAPRAGNTSETRLTDDSSRIVFNVVEDLGGGLQAIAQVDWRIAPDSAADGGGPTGNNHVGLRSKQWGRLFVGRQDLHYYNRESNLTVKGDLKADSISILSYAGTGIQSIAGATRTPNVVHYTTPNWGGFTVIAAYSTNSGAATEADIGGALRKGRAWNLNPNFQGPNYQIGYSYWSAKSDAPASSSVAACIATPAALTGCLVQAAAQADQRSDRLYGSYSWGNLMIGLAWDKSRLNAAPTALATPFAPAGTEISNRVAWSIPVQYTWGPHGIYAHFDKARSDRAAIYSGLDTSSKMYALSYQYDLSKRTSLALNYAQIKNASAATYNFFTSAAATIGSPSGTINPGEDPRLLTATLRHAF